MTDCPMITPIGTPMTTEKRTPPKKVLAVIQRAAAKVGVGTISTMRATIAERGGMTSVAPERPITSQRIAHTMSEANSGTR